MGSLQVARFPSQPVSPTCRGHGQEMGRGELRLEATLLRLAGDNSFLTPPTGEATFWERYAEKKVYAKTAKVPKLPSSTSSASLLSLVLSCAEGTVTNREKERL